jgi:branched-chain amino acid transport system substrate-binding protein
MIKRIALSTAAVSALVAGPALATDITLGVLNDQSGIYADLSGQGSVVAAQMAVADFDAAGKGINVEIISADHQNKADIAAAETLQRIGFEGVVAAAGELDRDELRAWRHCVRDVHAPP